VDHPVGRVGRCVAHRDDHGTEEAFHQHRGVEAFPPTVRSEAAADDECQFTGDTPICEPGSHPPQCMGSTCPRVSGDRRNSRLSGHPIQRPVFLRVRRTLEHGPCPVAGHRDQLLAPFAAQVQRSGPTWPGLQLAVVPLDRFVAHHQHVNTRGTQCLETPSKPGGVGPEIRNCGTLPSQHDGLEGRAGRTGRPLLAIGGTAHRSGRIHRVIRWTAPRACPLGPCTPPVYARCSTSSWGHRFAPKSERGTRGVNVQPAASVDQQPAGRLAWCNRGHAG